jgi:hypothetical protein
MCEIVVLRLVLLWLSFFRADTKCLESLPTSSNLLISTDKNFENILYKTVRFCTEYKVLRNGVFTT